MDNSPTRKTLTGLAYLAPNITGFLCFTLLPLIASFAMAFTNWDMRHHNMFSGETPSFVGLDNFTRLLGHPQFWQYFGNTLFLMMGIPFGIAGSLGAALLLNQEVTSGRASGLPMLRFISTTVLAAALCLLVALGFGATALGILLIGLFGVILVGGASGGNTVYRTIFYTPHLIAGVPVFILWKKLYSPETGPINFALRPVLESLTLSVRNGPHLLWTITGGLLTLLLLFLLYRGIRALARGWRDGEVGGGTLLLSLLLLTLPAALGFRWLPRTSFAVLCLGGFAVIAIALLAPAMRSERLETPAAGKGFGSYFMMAAALMVAAFVCVGLSIVATQVPAWAAKPEGLEAPKWVADFYWAKPSIMMMGLWAAIGSNNMILFLAGLTNVPQELYEAADIDGASRFQRFWHVTWPQLAPITFFVVVMSVINGLQGGFEMARTMTQGGPAGATTTLSYYIYNEGFQTGRIGYAAAISWVLFAFVFTVTLLNIRFGSRYVND